VRLQWCCIGVTVVFQWCCSGVKVVLQWCFSGVAVVLQWCCSGVAVALQWCRSGVTIVFGMEEAMFNRRKPCSGVTVVFQWCHRGFYNGVTVVVLQWFYSGVTVVLQWCYSGVTALCPLPSFVTLLLWYLLVVELLVHMLRKQTARLCE
jgi:hypothetical protein